MTHAITYDDILAARTRIAGFVRHTPLLSAPFIDRHFGARVLFKPECLQVTGSFKFRGASNRLEAMSAAERKRGVVAISSGNHAQGIAYAAAQRGIEARVVMPADAPEMKKRNTAAYGATVIEYDRYTESREEIGKRVQAEYDAVLVPPFDDPYVMAGQGTSAIEIAEDLADLGLRPDLALCCCGGGGLMAGFALALAEAYPDAAIYSAEPKTHDDTARSLVSGSREAIQADARSICDAIVTPTPGELTWPINKALLTGGLTASDDRALEAMRFAWEHLKLVLEPGGAIALACLLEAKAAGTLDIEGKTVVVMLSGGNVDQAMFARALTAS